VFSDPSSEHATLVQLDAIINHLLGIQILHRSLIDADIPKLARQKAESLGWHAEAVLTA
jgi:asparagine synthase (glutamine-hydrolysing)